LSFVSGAFSGVSGARQPARHLSASNSAYQTFFHPVARHQFLNSILTRGAGVACSWFTTAVKHLPIPPKMQLEDGWHEEPEVGSDVRAESALRCCQVLFKWLIQYI
jgi:hypothetical protein